MTLTNNPGADVASPPVEQPFAGKAALWTWIALGVSLAALVGSLLLSMGMGLKACPLCLYQRTFVMAVVGVLGLGLLARLGPAWTLSLLALPLAVAALSVGIFHVYLEATGKLECPRGILGLGSATQQALVVEVALVVALCVGAATACRAGAASYPTMVGAVLLGGLFMAGAVKSAPPMPPAPKAPYEQPADICRPPYRST
jgi:disulfide bond formation protein DsbB